MKKTSIMIAAVLFALQVEAQNSRYLSVEEAVETAVKNNSHIRMSELDRQAANADFHQTDAIFLPQITVGYTAMSTNNPLNAFGFLLQQESVSAMDFDPAKLNNPDARQNYSTQAEAKLPLLNVDMLYARKAAKAQEEVYQHKSQRTKEYIAFEMRKAYAQLQMSYRSRDILQKSLADVQQIEQSVSNFYAQGLVQKSDVLNAQVQVNTIKTALAKAESNILNASEGLRLLMGEEQGSEVYSVDSLAQQINLAQERELSASRADIQALSKAVDARDMMLKSSKMAFLPRINAFGSYGLNDSEPLEFRHDSYLVGVNLNWTVFSGNQNRSKMKSARFQHKKMQEELNLHIKKETLELNKTARELKDLQTEIEQQEISVAQADEALRILTNRHREGLVGTTDLLMAQAQLSQQQLLLSQAVMSYNITGAYLSFLSSKE